MRRLHIRMVAALCLLFFGAMLGGKYALGANVPDPNTGGGMGGTGHTVDDPRGMPMVPLSSTTRIGCSADKVVGRYLLSEQGSSSQGQLCEQTIFTITAGKAITLFLPIEQSISVESAGEVRLQVRRTNHHAWGPRIEVDLFSRKGEARAKINGSPLDIAEGFVGQVSVEQGQTFFRLRRQRGD